MTIWQSGTLGSTGLWQEQHGRQLGRLPRRQRLNTVTSAKKKGKPDYGSGRARLPGLADMPGLQGSSSGSGSGSSTSSAASSGPSRRSGSSSSSGGGSVEEPTLAEYLHFGRLMGERPQQVKQQLDISGVRVQIDEKSQEYLQDWEQEELQAYAMFEAVVAAEARRAGGGASAGPASAAEKKLQRNKNTLSAAATAEQLRAGARAQQEKGVPMTASQRRLARNKQNAGGLGAGMRASLEALMRQAVGEADIDDDGSSFELVMAARPAPPQAAAPVQLAAKPMRPPPGSEEFYNYGAEEDEEDWDDIWAEAEAEAAAVSASAGRSTTAAPPAALSYDEFDALLGKSSSSKTKAAKNPKASGRGLAFTTRASGSLAAVGQLKEAVPERPAQAQAQPPQDSGTGRVQLRLSKPATPVKLAAKPQASAAAREAAQRPAPPPPPPEPTLASKPSRPAAATPAPAAAAAPMAAKPAKQQAPPPLASKPEVRPPAAAAAAPEAAPPQRAKPARPAQAAVPAAEAASPLKAAAQAAFSKPPAKVTAKPPAAEARLTEEQPAEASAQTELPAAPPAAPPAPAAAAAASAPVKPQRAQAREQGEQERLQAQQGTVRRMQEERRATNAAYGIECLIDRKVETLTVWQVNAAGVLVRNERLSGFVPTSLLAPVLLSRVLAEEQKLAAAAAAGLIVAQLEQAAAPASSADGADMDAATRSAVRRAALEAVMMARQVSARVVNVDEKSGRVVLSERAAVSAWKGRGNRAAPPTLQELRAAAAQLGELVDATVVVVKPFGCFVEFTLDLPAQQQQDQGQGQEEGQAEKAVLVGLVHASEVSWNPSVDIMQAVQVGQTVRAKIIHVDAAKARVFLSFRRTAPNPLLETLDSLVTSSAAAAAAAAAAATDGSAGGASGAQGAAAALPLPAAAAPALDQRPALGDLPEAARFCQLLCASPAVSSATLGVRLQSRAASQSLEVYISKDPAAGIGSAVAAAGGASAELAAAPSGGGSAGAKQYNLVLRKEQSVQEVLVVAALEREDVRQLAASCIAALATETETEAGAVAA